MNFCSKLKSKKNHFARHKSAKSFDPLPLYSTNHPNTNKKLDTKWIE